MIMLNTEQKRYQYYRPLLKSDTAIQRYSDTRSQSRSRSRSRSHADFPGGEKFRPYKVKYISGNVKIHKESKV